MGPSDVDKLLITDPVAQEMLRELKQQLEERTSPARLSNDQKAKLLQKALVVPTWAMIAIIDGICVGNINEVPALVAIVLVSLIVGCIATALVLDV